MAGVAKGRLPPFDSLPRLATFPSSFSSFSSPARCSAVAAFFFLDLSWEDGWEVRLKNCQSQEEDLSGMQCSS